MGMYSLRRRGSSKVCLFFRFHASMLPTGNANCLGHAEQWGSVTRKKDKKPTSTTKDSSASRGDFRGGRGGRAARGGPRGGAARGASARGGHHEVNGHRAKPSTSGPANKDASAGDAATTAPVNGDAVDADTEAASTWGTSTPTTWGGDTAAINGTSPQPASAVTSTSSPAPAPVPVQPHAPAPAKVVSTPATSKLSWAQIARCVTMLPRLNQQFTFSVGNLRKSRHLPPHLFRSPPPRPFPHLHLHRFNNASLLLLPRSRNHLQPQPAGKSPRPSSHRHGTTNQGRLNRRRQRLCL